jgi:DNA-binding MarR family transcriptional regulator
MGKTASAKSDRRTKSILYLVKQVQYKAYVRLETVLDPLGVTAVQFRILTTLSTRPNLSSADLARLYDVTPQTMIKQISLLEAKGLIARRASDANKRLLELSLTPAGENAVQQLEKDTLEFEEELLEPLSNKEQTELRRYLRRLLESLSAISVREAAMAEEFAPEYRRPGVQGF